MGQDSPMAADDTEDICRHQAGQHVYGPHDEEVLYELVPFGVPVIWLVFM